MSWSQLAELILVVGWPAAERIMDGIDRGDQPVTAEERAALRSDVNASFEEKVGPRPEE